MRNENIESVEVEIDAVELYRKLTECGYNQDEISALTNAVFSYSKSKDGTKCKLETWKIKDRD